MRKQDPVAPDCGMVFGLNEEGSSDTCYNVDKPCRRYVPVHYSVNVLDATELYTEERLRR